MQHSVRNKSFSGGFLIYVSELYVTLMSQLTTFGLGCDIAPELSYVFSSISQAVF